MKTFTCNHTAGADIYFRIYNSDGEVFDFDDDTFKALGSATTPYIVATEQPDADGTGRSDYAAEIDTALISDGSIPAEFRIKYFDNATPAAGDLAIGGTTFRIPELATEIYECHAEGALLTTAGNEIRITAWLTYNGQTLPVTSGTCSIAIREHSASSDLLVLNSASPDVLGRFEFTQSNPGFTDDRLYMARITITVSAVPRMSDSPMVIVSV